MQTVSRRIKIASILRLVTALAICYAFQYVRANIVRFSLPALPSQSTDKSNVRCVGYNALKNQFFRVEYDVSDGASQTMGIEVFDKTPNSNSYHHKSGITGKTSFVFTVHDSANVQFCFSNILEDGVRPSSQTRRDVTLKIDTGVAAHDDNDIQKASEHLSPAMIELRRFHLSVKELVREMEEIKKREESMRDTNEETLNRVTRLSSLVIFVLIALALWQILYLRNYFRSKRLM